MKSWMLSLARSNLSLVNIWDCHCTFDNWEEWMCSQWLTGWQLSYQAEIMFSSHNKSASASSAATKFQRNKRALLERFGHLIQWRSSKKNLGGASTSAASSTPASRRRQQRSGVGERQSSLSRSLLSFFLVPLPVLCSTHRMTDTAAPSLPPAGGEEDKETERY
jgi:hypothetical protein